MTAGVEEFLGNAFSTTYYSRMIENLNWKPGQSREIIGSKT